MLAAVVRHTCGFGAPTGVGLGAALHGFVPDGWIASHLGQGQWWSVPTAVLLGIPLYANATGVIPVMESLITKELPVGTTLAFCMSTVACQLSRIYLAEASDAVALTRHHLHHAAGILYPGRLDFKCHTLRRRYENHQSIRQ